MLLELVTRAPNSPSVTHLVQLPGEGERVPVAIQIETETERGDPFKDYGKLV